MKVGQFVKQEFIEFLNALMEAAPEVAKEKMTSNVEAYIEALQDNKNEKPILTDNGKQILDYLQKHQDKKMLKAREIAEDLFISSRGVSGALRKLVNDGFVDKMGENPVIYTITEKGKNFVID